MKKSLITFTCILSALCILLCGCSKSEAPEGYHNAAGDHEAFYFYVPTTWTLNNTGGTASAYYSSSDMSNVSMTCMVIEPETMDDLEEYFDITTSQLEEILPNFQTFISVEMLESESSEESTAADSDTTAEDTTESETTAEGTTEVPKVVGRFLTTYPIGGRDSILFEYECTLSGQTYYYMQVVTMKDDYFYIFTYSSLKENYYKHIDDIKGIIAYIAFK